MNLTAEEVKRHGPIHTKLATYGLFGLPVITAGDSLAGYPAGLHDSLCLVPPEDPQCLADTCLQIRRNPKKRQRLAEALQRYVRKHLTWRRVAREILNIMSASEKKLA